ncbi:MAG: thioredoxin domain-containing protein [Leptolyngbyaceae cyanobacterium SU_3_3]|nr:thioredoxin domain-containing protein [Leptolyngbyaceae cyanobacterium SU_3_3]NJR50118.1 thioredoxin domain-containing protein [Leptolyngbyaceae cyanobacterium CSU_1_3]
MKKLTSRSRLQQRFKFIAVAILSFLLLVAPVQADPISPQLEDQVLQIIRKHPEVILESVRVYQQKQQAARQQAQQSFVQNMKTNPRAIIGQSPTRGAQAGKIVLVEFSDFQCPYCAAAHTTLKQFMNKHGNEVTLVYKHFPLTTIHAEAMPAAKAAWAAGQQNKFWNYHDALFSNQSQLGEAFYQETAKSLRLDLKRFERDRTSKTAEAAIAQDIEMAEKLGVSGTPFFVMNGAVLSGSVELSELEATLAKVKKE